MSRGPNRGAAPSCPVPGRWARPLFSQRGATIPTCARLAAVTVATGLAWSAIGAGAARLAQDPPRFRTALRLVEVYASVTDARGAVVDGLTRDDFEIFEEGRPRPVVTFLDGEAPVAIVLVLDRSFSMRGDRLVAARRAAKALLSRLAPGDRSAVVAVGSQVEVVTGLSADHGAAAAAIDTLEAWGTTPLHDALVASLDLLEAAGGRRALVVLGDGEDRYSRAADSEVDRRVRETGVLVYPVVIGRPPSSLLAGLAALSGGRLFAARDPARIEPAFLSVIDELRRQYVLGYEPEFDPSVASGTWRSIRVAVRGAGRQVRARSGYLVR